MWIPVTLVAVIFQITRTSEQHRIRSVLNTSEAGYVRFAYAFPMAAAGSAIWFGGPGTLPSPDWHFWLGICGGGTSQILATVALLESFKRRDFAIGTLYSKTEVLFVGVGSAVLLGETLPPAAWLGVAICIAGFVWLANHKLTDDAGLFKLDPAAAFGILAAAGFAFAAIGIRSASNSLEGSTAERALFTLTLMLGFQTTLQGTIIWRSSTSSLAAVAAAWKPATRVAILSLFGSFSWAIALTLENAARVRTLGQVEIVLAFIIGAIVHAERHHSKEYAAGMVITAGIALVVAS